MLRSKLHVKTVNFHDVNHHFALREMDSGTPEAFTHMLRVICDNELLKYSSVASPLCYHLGLTFNPSEDRENWQAYWRVTEYKKIDQDSIDHFCRIFLDYLNTPPPCNSKISGNNPMEIFLKVRALAHVKLEDAARAIMKEARSSSTAAKASALFAAKFIGNAPLSARCVSAAFGKSRHTEELIPMSLCALGVWDTKAGVIDSLHGAMLTKSAGGSIVQAHTFGEPYYVPAINKSGDELSLDELRQLYRQLKAIVDARSAFAQNKESTHVGFARQYPFSFSTEDVLQCMILLAERAGVDKTGKNKDGQAESPEQFLQRIFAARLPNTAFPSESVKELKEELDSDSGWNIRDDLCGYAPIIKNKERLLRRVIRTGYGSPVQRAALVDVFSDVRSIDTAWEYAAGVPFTDKEYRRLESFLCDEAVHPLVLLKLLLQKPDKLESCVGRLMRDAEPEKKKAGNVLLGHLEKASNLPEYRTVLIKLKQT